MNLSEILIEVIKQTVYSLSVFLNKVSIDLIGNAENIINSPIIGKLQFLGIMICIAFIMYKLIRTGNSRKQQILYIKNAVTIICIVTLSKYLIEFIFNTWGSFISELDILERIQFIFEASSITILDLYSIQSIFMILGYTLLLMYISISQIVGAMGIGLLMIIMPFVVLFSFKNKDIVKSFNMDLSNYLVPQIITPLLLYLLIPIAISLQAESISANEFLIVMVMICICYSLPNLLKSLIKEGMSLIKKSYKLKDKDGFYSKDMNTTDTSKLFTIK